MFNGVDDTASFESIYELSKCYGITWGIQIDPAKYGTPGYPSYGWLMQFNAFLHSHKKRRLENPDIFTPRIEVYPIIQGEMAEMLVEDGYTSIEDILDVYSRVQVNVGDSKISHGTVETLSEWGNHYGKGIVLQVHTIPGDENFRYVQDRSCGEGIYLGRENWDKSSTYEGRENGRIRHRGEAVGYGGGLTLDNILETCWYIGDRCNPYYYPVITSGVREGGEFIIHKASEFCKLLYGDRALDSNDNIIIINPDDGSEISIGDDDDIHAETRDDYSYGDYVLENYGPKVKPKLETNVDLMNARLKKLLREEEKEEDGLEEDVWEEEEEQL